MTENNYAVHWIFNDIYYYYYDIESLFFLIVWLVPCPLCAYFLMRRMVLFLQPEATISNNASYLNRSFSHFLSSTPTGCSVNISLSVLYTQVVIYDEQMGW